MTRIPDRGSNVSPLLDAGLLLAARRSFRRHGLEHPTAAAILEATGAGRTRAYELAAEVTALLPGLERPVGRPRNPCEATDDSNTSPATSAPLLQDEVLDYLMANPGCVSRLERHRYSHGFRHFVVQLRERYPTMPLSPFANAVHVPAKTLQGWIRDVAQALEPKPAWGVCTTLLQSRKTSPSRRTRRQRCSQESGRPRGTRLSSPVAKTCQTAALPSHPSR